MRLNAEYKKMLYQFYELTKELRKAGIIRSDNIFGDIGEFLCNQVYPNLTLVQSKTNPSYDATENGRKIQIKFSDSTKAKNIHVGDPDKYDELIVVLGPNSVHRYKKEDCSRKGKILFYRYTNQDVKKKFITKKGFSLSQTKQFKPAEQELEL